MHALQRLYYSFVSSTLLFALALVADSALAQPLPKLTFEFYDLAVEQRGGTFAVLQFKSRHPVVPLVAASQQPLAISPGGKEFANPPADIESTSFSILAPETTKHRVALRNLKPNTEYFVGIIGHRKSGPADLPVLNVPRFTTKQRRVSITFERIEMIDDSDDLSDGEFIFGFFAYDGTPSFNTPPLAELQYPRDYFALVSSLVRRMMFGSGESRSIPAGPSMSILFNKDRLKLEATGVDNDDLTPPGGQFQSPCGKGLVGPHSGADSTACGDFATGSTRITFENKTQVSGGATLSQQERHQIPFVLHANPGKVDLEFKVKGHVTVSYE